MCRTYIQYYGEYARTSICLVYNLVGKSNRKRLVWRRKRRWENNINMIFQNLGVNWVQLAEDRAHLQVLSNSVSDTRVTQTARNLLNISPTFSFSKTLSYTVTKFWS
jgi:hypothetical protein